MPITHSVTLTLEPKPPLTLTSLVMGKGLKPFEEWDRLHSSMIRSLDSYVSLIPVALGDGDTLNDVGSRTKGGDLKAMATAEDALCLALDILEEMKRLMFKYLKELDTERRKMMENYVFSSASDQVSSICKVVSMERNVAVCEQELQVRDNAANTVTSKRAY